jgi:hypothetical protein
LNFSVKLKGSDSLSSALFLLTRKVGVSFKENPDLYDYASLENTLRDAEQAPSCGKLDYARSVEATAHSLSLPILRLCMVSDLENWIIDRSGEIRGSFSHILTYNGKILAKSEHGQ